MVGRVINLLAFASIWLILAVILTIPLIVYSKELMLDRLLVEFDYGSVQSLTPEQSALLGVVIPPHRTENRFYLGLILSLPLAFFLSKKLQEYKKTKVLITGIGILTAGTLFLYTSGLRIIPYSEDMQPRLGECRLFCIF